MQNLRSALKSNHSGERQGRARLLRNLILALIMLGSLPLLAILAGLADAYWAPFLPPQLADLIGVRPGAGLTGATPAPGTPGPKTLWDLFEILIIPALLGGGALLIEHSLKEIERSKEEERIKEARYKEYLSRLETAILQQDLVHSKKEAVGRALANAYTRDAVKRLDGAWLGMLLDFLDTYGLDLAGNPEPILDLSQLYFHRAIFSGRKFTNLCLRSAQMPGSTWDGVVCRAVELSDSNLRGARLRGAHFYECNLTNVDFQGADLRAAEFDFCELSGAQFQDADLRGATFPATSLDRVQIDRHTRLDAQLATRFYLYTQLQLGQPVHIPSSHLEGAVLIEADLAGARLAYADLRKADLSNALLGSSDLSWARLREAILAGADLRQANLAGADLERADLSGADLRGTDLRAANLKQAYLYDARLDETTQIALKWRLVAQLVSESRPEELGDVDFKDAYLSYADFSELDLRQRSFAGANLNHANFSGADLRGAVFSCSSGATSAPGISISPLEAGLPAPAIDFLRRRWPWLWARLVTRLRRYLVYLTASPSEACVTILEGASLRAARLEGADFRGVRLNHISLHDSTIDEETRFDHKWQSVWEVLNQPAEKRSLAYADLAYTDLSAAQLKEADLRHASLVGADLQQANLAETDLSFADLSGADLSGADLSDANLSGARATQGQLRKARSLHNARLEEVAWIE